MKDLTEKISASLLDDLSPEERAELETVLASDPDARARQQELSSMNDLLARHHADHESSPNLEQRMVAAFRRGSEKRPLSARIPGWFRLPPVYIPTAAGALVLLVTLGSYLTNESPRPITWGYIAGGRQPDNGRGETLDFYYKQVADGLVTGKEIADARGVVELGGRQPGEAARIVTWDANEARLYADDGAALPAAPPVAEQGWAGTGSGSAGALNGTFGTDRKVALAEGELAKKVADEVSDLGLDEKAEETVPLYQFAYLAEAKDGEPQPQNSVVDARKLIRNATAEIEVSDFATGINTLSDLARAAGGYVATQQSSKLPNGKMSGAIVLKIPPTALDGFLKQLQTVGEIRNQSVGTEDITKAYFDTEARMKNARVMEQRLVELLRDTKGKVSDLLQVEKELGRVREQIEQMQGELKLWDSLVSFATVSVQLFEKDMNEAAAYLLREAATLSLATTDVEKTFTAARKVADEDKAQVTQSNITRDGSGNATAVLALVVEPGDSDATIERLKALGNVLDFRVESNRIARDGNQNAPNAKVEREPVHIMLSIRSQDQNPTQHTQLRLETDAVQQSADKLRTYAAENAIEIKDSGFTQQPDGRKVATLRLLLPLMKNADLMSFIENTGKVEDLSVQRNDSPDAASIEPRAEVALTISQPPRLVANENGLLATIRRTFGQAVGALMWSLRMIGVALAFLAPWIVGIAAIALIVRFARRRAARKG